ncbi:MAG: response regulator [Ferruginibacter sp.]
MNRTSDQTTKTIFLADDDPDDRMLFEEALKSVDQTTQVTMAHDGEHLMDILVKEVLPHPFLIFLDLNMPRKNGLECLKEIKKSERLKNIPVVVFSTSCQKDAINQMYEHGASYYICKPDSFQKLIKSIDKIFSLNWNDRPVKPQMKDFIIAF